MKIIQRIFGNDPEAIKANKYKPLYNTDSRQQLNAYRRRFLDFLEDFQYIDGLDEFQEFMRDKMVREYSKLYGGTPVYDNGKNNEIIGLTVMGNLKRVDTTDYNIFMTKYENNLEFNKAMARLMSKYNDYFNRAFNYSAQLQHRSLVKYYVKCNF